MTEATSRLALPLLQAGQAQKEVFHNEALVRLDIALHAAVETIGADLPPLEPKLGACWIVGIDPKAEWIGRAGQIAAWTIGGWRFVEPAEGMVVWCVKDTVWVQHIGDTWIRGRLMADSLWIGGKQVVGDRRPAVSSPTGGATIDAEARVTLAAILTTLQAHGLIDA